MVGVAKGQEANAYSDSVLFSQAQRNEFMYM